MITIEELKTLDKQTHKELHRLLSQLISPALPIKGSLPEHITRLPPLRHLSFAAMKSVIENDASCVLVARENGVLVGSGSVIFSYTMSGGLHGYLEDVVVDSDYRGKGIGRELTQKLIGIAKKRKARYIDLTSKPVRIAANKLYQSLGFKKRETNCYRMYL